MPPRRHGFFNWHNGIEVNQDFAVANGNGGWQIVDNAEFNMEAVQPIPAPIRNEEEARLHAERMILLMEQQQLEARAFRIQDEARRVRGRLGVRLGGGRNRNQRRASMLSKSLKEGDMEV